MIAGMGLIPEVSQLTRDPRSNWEETVDMKKSGFTFAATLIVICTLALSLFSSNASAKTEYRSFTWAWCIWGDCGNTGDYETSDAALDAWNASIDQQYSQCLASAAGAECGSGCRKSNHYNASIPAAGLTVIMNGQGNWLMTVTNVSTYFGPSCKGQPGSSGTTDDGGASIATYGKDMCPTQGGWSMHSGPATYVDVNGQQIQSRAQWCQREVPDCPICDKSKAKKPLFGDPISPVDQTQNEAETDYASADGLLHVGRYYSSGGGGRWMWGSAGIVLADFTGRSGTVLPTASGFTASILAWKPGTGTQVDTPRSFPLIKTQPDTGQKEVWIFLSSGSREIYTEGPTGVFTTTALGKSTLSVSTLPSGAVQWALKTQSDGYYVFDNTGALVQHVFTDGKVLSYTNQGAGLVVSSNPGGRTITYTKDPTSGQYSFVTLPDGQRINYTVDNFAAISAVTYPDSSAKTYLYNEPTYTGVTSAPGLLTGVVDENGVRQATFTYSGGNVAVSTERAGGVDKYSSSLTYDSTSGSTTVTLPGTNSQSRLSWEAGPDGERRLVSQSQPAGSGSAASSSAISYDANGNVASKDDFNGGRACFANDLTRNLETTRVEGLSNATSCSGVTVSNATLPSGSRKISTAWHPDWLLATMVAEPGRITTSVYNGQPDPFNGNAVTSCAPSTALLPDGKPIAVLCKQVQQATTDVDGHLGFTAALQSSVANRVQSWTYNSYGQVLTATDPLNHSTTYAYYTDTAFTGTDPNTVGHTIGDLSQVTNPAGQTTQFTSYNKHGQVLRSIDPNGLVTDNTYDLRQRLTSTTIAGQQTVYTYDPAGQLIQLALPDTTSITYTYDAAHRLTKVTDQAGNSIAYTLDNAGNRTQDQIKDPSGNLARTVTRAFDALNRVQQVTGAAR